MPAIETHDGTEIYYKGLGRRSARHVQSRMAADGGRMGCADPTLKVYPGLSHGMCTVNADQINADLLAFLK
jgi:hypothetical protein